MATRRPAAAWLLLLLFHAAACAQADRHARLRLATGRSQCLDKGDLQQQGSGAHLHASEELQKCGVNTRMGARHVIRPAVALCSQGERLVGHPCAALAPPCRVS